MVWMGTDYLFLNRSPSKAKIPSGTLNLESAVRIYINTPSYQSNPLEDRINILFL